jgi:hypothetical protein
MQDDTRPNWDFKEMSEQDFEAIYNFGRIQSITAGFTFTSADSGYEFLEVYNYNNDTMCLPQGWKSVLKFVGYFSNPGLFTFTDLGCRMITRLNSIKQWEQNNAADLAEYQRLKKKFEG